VLGAEFQEMAGQFWQFLETRPYMRALEGQSRTCIALGRHREAIAVMELMLELNPDDNQGMRRKLLKELLILEENERAARLIDESYPDEACALWGWARWLLAFRNRLPGPVLKELARAAHQRNVFVVLFLLGERRLPDELPHESGFGGESEALLVVEELLAAFTATAGAKAWLESAAAELGLSPCNDPEDIARYRKRLLAEATDTAQNPAAVWLVQYRKFKFDGDSVWPLLVIDRDTREVREWVIMDSSPGADDVLEVVLQAMVESEVGVPRRPGTLLFSLKTLAKSLSKRLDLLNIHCAVHDVSEMDSDFEAFRKSLVQPP
jgi:hypothetical protein